MVWLAETPSTASSVLPWCLSYACRSALRMGVHIAVLAVPACMCL
jgi:hypothetical protein